MAKISLEQLIDLAFANEEGDPIDWGVFQSGKEEAMIMIGTSILDMFNKETWTDEHKFIAMATITKLTVENFVLHARLMKNDEV